MVRCAHSYQNVSEESFSEAHELIVNRPHGFLIHHFIKCQMPFIMPGRKQSHGKHSGREERAKGRRKVKEAAWMLCVGSGGHRGSQWGSNAHRYNRDKFQSELETNLRRAFKTVAFPRGQAYFSMEH